MIIGSEKNQFVFSFRFLKDEKLISNNMETVTLDLLSAGEIESREQQIRRYIAFLEEDLESLKKELKEGKYGLAKSKIQEIERDAELIEQYLIEIITILSVANQFKK